MKKLHQLTLLAVLAGILSAPLTRADERDWHHGPGEPPHDDGHHPHPPPPPPPPPPVTFDQPIYRNVNLQTLDFYQTTDPNGFPGYVNQGITFYTSRSPYAPAKPLVPIYRCLSPQIGNFVSRDGNCEGIGSNLLLLGYISDTPRENAQSPLYRCAGKTLLTTKSLADCAMIKYTVQTTLGYVP